MKFTLISLAFLLSLAACSQPNAQVTKGNDSNDLFQQKSIANIGLKHVLALTFDDGPDSKYTPILLDYLKEQGIHASFFLNGWHVKGSEWILRRMDEEGHVVGNHSQDHDDLSAMAKKQGMKSVIDQIMDTDQLIRPFFQPGGRQYFRAPYGAWRNVVSAELNANQILRDYVGPMFWDIGGEISRDPKTHKIILDKNGNPLSSADWDCWGINPTTKKQNLTVKQCAGGYLNETHKFNGGIVLMHDKSPGTIQLVKTLVPIWKSEGFTFVTLDQVQSLDKYTDQNSVLAGQAQAQRNRAALNATGPQQDHVLGRE